MTSSRSATVAATATTTAAAVATSPTPSRISRSEIAKLQKTYLVEPSHDQIIHPISLVVSGNLHGTSIQSLQWSVQPDDNWNIVPTEHAVGGIESIGKFTASVSELLGQQEIGIAGMNGPFGQNDEPSKTKTIVSAKFKTVIDLHLVHPSITTLNYSITEARNAFQDLLANIKVGKFLRPVEIYDRGLHEEKRSPFNRPHPTNNARKNRRINKTTLETALNTDPVTNQYAYVHRRPCQLTLADSKMQTLEDRVADADSEIHTLKGRVGELEKRCASLSTNLKKAVEEKDKAVQAVKESEDMVKKLKDEMAEMKKKHENDMKDLESTHKAELASAAQKRSASCLNGPVMRIQDAEKMVSELNDQWKERLRKQANEGESRRAWGRHPNRSTPGGSIMMCAQIFAVSNMNLPATDHNSSISSNDCEKLVGETSRLLKNIGIEDVYDP